MVGIYSLIKYLMSILKWNEIKLLHWGLIVLNALETTLAYDNVSMFFVSI